MSSSKKIHNRLNKLFTDIKEDKEHQPAPTTAQKKEKRVSSSIPAPTQVSTTPRQDPARPVQVFSGLQGELPSNVTIAESGPGSSSTLMTIPFQTGDEWNLIQLEKESPQRWREEDQALVKQIVDQLGLALQNAHLFGETQKSASQMASVAEIATEISSVLDLQPLLEIAVGLTQRRFGLYHAHIFLFDKNQNSLDVKACGWEEGDIHQGTHGTRQIDINADVSIVARAAREKKPVVDNDVHADPSWLSNPMLPNVQSEMAIPVISGDQVLGVLNLHSDRLNFFTTSDVSIMTTLATQIGSAIQNARLFDETQKRARELATLNEIVRAVSEQIGLKQVLDAAYHQIKKLVPVDAFVVALLDEKENMLNYPIVIDEGIYYEEAPGPLTPGNFTGQTILTGKIIEKYRNPDEAEQSKKDTGIVGNTTKLSNSLLYFPLKLAQKTIGSLSIQSYSFSAYKPEDVSLLENITNQISVGIQNARLFEQARDRARREQLLREITSRVRGSTDPDTILRTVVREVGQALGMQTFIHIGNAKNTVSSTETTTSNQPLSQPVNIAITGNEASPDKIDIGQKNAKGSK